MKVLLLNGPNLNMLGKREPGIYGKKTLKDIEQDIANLGKSHNIEVSCFQSNSEGELVTEIQKAGDVFDGIIFNAGAYTHTSIAIRDAISSIKIPVIEVHLSNISNREPFRHISYISPVCAGSISGLGEESYVLALFWFVRLNQKKISE